MIRIDSARTARDLQRSIDRVFDRSAGKILAIDRRWRPADGAPVFTLNGRYQARGWTEWTQGFQFGSALLQFDGTGDRVFLELGRAHTVERMSPHLTHMGVHDHGFNNVSTYGNLWRLAREGQIDASEWELRFYELALKVSGAVQARRWTRIPNGGFIYSFNGAHSLFVDTIRSLRALALGHTLGQTLSEEQDASVSCSTRVRPRTSASITAADATASTSGVGPRTRACSMPPTAATADRARSRAIRRLRPGHAVSPGRCSGSPNSSSSCQRCPIQRSRP
jgi:unsaturated chondroitin disaccharide hydrolase